MIEVDNKINVRTIWQHLLALLKFGAVNKGDHWAVKALPIVKKLLKHNSYDYILTRAQPSHLIGNYVKQKYHVKWVCTWNDPFPTEMYPKPYGKGNDETIASKYAKTIRIMQNADTFIYPNKRLAVYMNKFIKVADDRIRVIPHVMMEEPQLKVRAKSNKLCFIHSGDCTGERSAHNLLIAIKELITQGTIQCDEILLSFIGRINEADRELLKDPILNKIVELRAPVSYLDSLEILKDYDVAVIIEASWEEGVFLPTKVSDFMMKGKRVLAISPCVGVLHDLYEEGFIQYFADVSNYLSIKNEVSRIINDSKSGEWNNLTINVPIEYTKSYVLNEFINI
jgi:hypothetical protein